jgi:phage FluMu protein gp41
MSKTRKRNTQKGAKSIAVRIKHKIGGRKSTRGLRQMSMRDVMHAEQYGRPRDRAKATQEFYRRLRLNPWADCPPGT